MEAFALYLFKSVVWLTGFALVYLLFLRNERYFVLNRIYLIAGILASIMFPFFTWHYTIVIPFTPSVEVSDLQMTAVISEPETFPTKTILFYAYTTGAIYLLYRIIRQTITVIRVIQNAEILPYRSAKLIRTAKYPSSFSFFSFVFVNPSSSETETREIVNHELEHVKQRHWIDLVLFELLCTLQWLNPLCWLYGRFIRQNHEFLADQYALQRTANPAIYRAALINQLFGAEVISLANSFNYSINKKRFHMMRNTIHPPYRKLKLLVILPLIAGVFYAFATPEYKYIPSGENSIAAVQEAKSAIENSPGKAQDTVKSSVTTLEGNFVASSPMGESSPVSGFRFSAKKIQGQSGKGTEIVKGEDISLDLRNTTSTIFIDGKEASKAEFDKLDPNTIASVSILKGEPATSKYGNKGKNGIILISLKKDDSKVYSQVDVMPEFPGGEAALRNFLATNIRYPKAAFERGIEGKVYVTFVVDKTGKVTDAKVARGADLSLDEEALRVVQSLPLWKPGKQGGKDVKVDYTIPINFALDKGQANPSQDNNEAYTVVEQMPEFPGGEEALKAYIASNIKYPLIALDNGIQGKVYVSFVVNKTGSIRNVKVFRGVDASLDQEAKRVVESMPAWVPGKQNGKTVDVTYELPINFKLPSDYNIRRGKRWVWYSTGIKPEDQAAENHQLIFNGNTGKGSMSFTLKGTDYNGIVDVGIYDRNGKIVKTESKNGPTFSLSNSDFPSGPSFIYARAGSHQYTCYLGFSSSYTTFSSKSASNKKAEVKPTVNQAAQINELIIVPNPTNDKAMITLKGSDYNSKLQVSVFDKDGKLILKDSKTGPTFNLSFANYTSGYYFIVVKAGNDQYSGHLIVNH